MAYVSVKQRRARAARRQEQRVQRRLLFAADPSIAIHGKASTYTNYGCRCVPCREAGVAAVQDYRVRMRARKARRSTELEK